MNLFKKAAALRRKNKRLTVPQSVKLAAKQARSAKRNPAKRGVGATKFIERGERKGAPAKRVYQVRRSAKGLYKGVKRVSGMPVVAGISITAQLAQTRRVLLAEIGALEAKKFAAKKVTEKRKIGKSIAAKKSLYKKLSQ